MRSQGGRLACSSGSCAERARRDASRIATDYRRFLSIWAPEPRWCPMQTNALRSKNATLIERGRSIEKQIVKAETEMVTEPTKEFLTEGRRNSWQRDRRDHWRQASTAALGERRPASREGPSLRQNVGSIRRRSADDSFPQRALAGANRGPDSFLATTRGSLSHWAWLPDPPVLPQQPE